MAFGAIADIIKAAEKMPLWEAVIEDDISDRGVSRETSYNHMMQLWTAMKAAITDYDPDRRSPSGLSGGDGGRMDKAEPVLLGEYCHEVVATALKTGECNACMRRIVAAPTAGASGVLPAVLMPAQKKLELNDDEMVKALFVAGGFGQVIATRASISGAEGGCQAEVGSASSMAAAALVFIRGGTPQMMAEASAMAIKNILGLVCDPVAGLVEVPCIKRNVMGSMNAVACAEMALAGVKSAIPCDEVIDAMRSVGEALPSTLRETGQGGLAVTPTGLKVVSG